MLETTEQRTHPLRLELDNFFFVQAIAGPERSRIVGEPRIAKIENPEGGEGSRGTPSAG